jgi:hypothetical protein
MMQYIIAIFNTLMCVAAGVMGMVWLSIINLFGQNEETYEVQIRHGGNQLIDEFYEKKENGRPDYNKKKRKPMTIHIGKSKTILDVKKKIKIQRSDGSYLSVFGFDDRDNFNLKTSVFGKNISNSCPLEIIADVEKIENNIIKLYIVIPDW